MRRIVGLIAAVAAFIGVSACFALAVGQASPATALEVELGESAIEVGRTSLPSGRVDLITSNGGRQEHELLIVATDLAPDRLPTGLEGPAVGRAGRVVYGRPHSHEHQGRGSSGLFDHLAPGRTRRETIDLAPGRYVLLCTLPGHYAAGQRAGLTVTPAR